MGSDNRPISVVLHDVAQNIQDIVRSEFRLAKAEVGADATKMKAAGLLIASAALAGCFGVVFVLLTAMYALQLAMPHWLAALTVAIGVGLIAGITLSAGMKRLRRLQGAPKTVASIKENVEWAKQ